MDYCWLVVSMVTGPADPALQDIGIKLKTQHGKQPCLKTEGKQPL